MKEFISDEDMKKLDFPNPTPNKKEFISDAEMDQLSKRPSYASQFDAVQELPTIGAIGGGLLGGVPGAAGGAYAGESAKNLLNLYNENPHAPKTHKEAVLGPVAAGTLGAAGEYTGQMIGKGIGKVAEKVAPYVKPVTDKISDMSGKVKEYIQNKAGEYGRNAIGATRVQAEKFKPGTGPYVLENDIVNMFSHPKDIRDNASRSMKDFGQKIGKSINKLSDAGGSLNKDEINHAIQNRVSELSKNEANRPLAERLSKFGNDLVEDKNIPFNRPLSAIEEVKRVFQQPGFKSLDPEVKKFEKEISNIYLQEVEKKATQTNPETAKEFIDAKNNYGMLKPIKTFAGKRATQLEQHPHFGFLDMTTAAGAGLAGHHYDDNAIIPAALAVVMRRALAPRVAATIGKALYKLPELVPVLEAAAKKSPQALSTTVYLLMKDPRFKTEMENVGE